MNRYIQLDYIVLCLLFVFSDRIYADIFVIVNKNNDIDMVTKEQIYRIYLRKTKRYQNGVVAIPYSRDEDAKVRSIFNKSILQRSEQQLRYYWARKMFSGGEHPPPIISSEQEVLEIVSDDIGAISYVSKKPDANSVKVVLELRD